MFHRRRHQMLVAAVAALGLTAASAGTAAEQQAPAGEMTESEIIRKAVSAAPPQLRDEATVIGPGGEVLREGTNGFTCMITPEVPTGAAPICADEVWMPWIDAWANNKPFDGAEGIGIAYMLEGDAPGGGASNIDPFAQAPARDNHWVVEGPHVMLIAPDEAMLSHLPTTPDTDGPYIMWSGTPFAHVMLPVAPRPEQRQVAEGE